MAETSFGVNHPLAVKLWARKLFVEALKTTWFNKLMGRNSGALVQVMPETSKQAGDTVTFGLRMQLSGDGVQGDATLEGNEEALTTYSDSLVINQLRHAVISGGRMSEQRVPFSVREEARAALTDWWADRLDWGLMNQLAGYTPRGDTKYTGNNVVNAPTNTILAASSTNQTPANEAALDASTVFDLAMIDKAVARAKTMDPAFRPVRVGGNEYFVGIIHPFQTYQLRRNAGDMQWADIQKAALAGGAGEKSPIFTGALGIYNGVVLHESSRIPAGVTAGNAPIANVKRAVFCGAQAAVVAFGRDQGAPETFSWAEELFDYGNKLGVGVGGVLGVKKTRFNGADFAAMVLSSYSPQP